MLTRRDLLLLAGAGALSSCSSRPGHVAPANQPQPKIATVTLAISGMT